MTMTLQEADMLKEAEMSVQMTSERAADRGAQLRYAQVGDESLIEALRMAEAALRAQGEAKAWIIVDRLKTTITLDAERVRRLREHQAETGITITPLGIPPHPQGEEL
jgi:predicted methyltransferase MtxX (methanogen marker protein 4)